MHFAMLLGIELRVGMGVGDGPTRFVAYFRSDLTWGQRSSRGQSALEMPLGLPNLVRRTPDQSVVHCWGQRSCRGYLGSTRGQIA